VAVKEKNVGKQPKLLDVPAKKPAKAEKAKPAAKGKKPAKKK